MEPATQGEALAKQTSDFTEGRTGKNPNIQTGNQESPLDEVRKLVRIIEEGKKEQAQLADRMEKMMADMALSGKGFAGKPRELTEEELKQKAIDDYSKLLTSAYKP